MKRRYFIAALVGTTLWPLVAQAEQPATKVRRIGWLVTGTQTSYRLSLAAFLDGLKALGYVEGRNISIEYRWAEGHVDRLPALLSELVAQRVDLIVLPDSTAGSIAAKRMISTVPIVFGISDELRRLQQRT